MEYDDQEAPSVALPEAEGLPEELEELTSKFKRRVRLTQLPYSEQPPDTEENVIEMLSHRFSLPVELAEELASMKGTDATMAFKGSEISSRLTNAFLALLGRSSFKNDFIQVGESDYRTVYIPVFQVLCAGEAGARFETFVEFIEQSNQSLGIQLELKGLGLSHSAVGSFSVTFGHTGGLRGQFQLALPAIVKISKYRHVENDDITGTKSEIIEVDAEASIITPSEVEFVEVKDLKYKPSRRFGALKTLPKISYQFSQKDSLKGTISLGIGEDLGTFGLNASVTDSEKMAVRFEAVKKGVFSQKIAASGPLAHMFDATNLRL